MQCTILPPLFARTDSIGLCTCRYPGEVIPGLLYLGNWEHAQNFAALKDLGVTRYSFAHTTQLCVGLLQLSFSCYTAKEQGCK